MTDLASPELTARRPRPSGQALISGGLIAVLALVLLDGGIAAWAQATARRELAAEGVNLAQYSLTRHLLAMLLLSIFTVAVSALLLLERQRLMAVLVLTTVAAGPMSVIASPVRMSLLNSDFQDTRWWWHLIVQGAQLVILLTSAWWTSRCLRVPGFEPLVSMDPLPPGHSRGRISGSLLFSLFLAVTLTAQILARPENGLETPSLLVMIGWAALGAAGAVAAAESPRRAAGSFVLAGAVVAVEAVHLAYHRPGGWPGVAGWENGGESPIVMSLGAAFCVLAGPLIGGVLRQRHSPASIPIPRGSSSSDPQPDRQEAEKPSGNGRTEEPGGPKRT